MKLEEREKIKIENRKIENRERERMALRCHSNPVTGCDSGKALDI